MAPPLMVGLLALAACVGAAPLQQTQWQRSLLQRLAGDAQRESRAASQLLEERLARPDVRAELQVCSPEAAKLTPTALAERLRAEVRVAEVVSGFTAKGWPYRMSLEEAADGPGYFQNEWEVGVRQGFNFSTPGSTGHGWFDIQDDVEIKLYGLRPFSQHGYPQSIQEASERAPYNLVNIYRLDSGSQLYGDVSVVLSTVLGAKSSVVSSVDTGGWTALCNTSGAKKFPGFPWPPPGYKANCSAYRKFTGLGTLEHFDHLFLMNEEYWNASIARVACRLLAPWGHYPIHGSDLFHYWEALPAARLGYPSAIKFVIIAFDSLFGTALGAHAQRWCAANGWVLIWSLGLNTEKPLNFWTATTVSWPLASNRRLADPVVLAQTTAARNMSLLEPASSTFRAAWSKANATRRAALAANRTVANTTWAGAWSRLSGALPAALHLQPLLAGACSDVNACVGITAEGHCLCYHRAPVDLVI